MIPNLKVNPDVESFQNLKIRNLKKKICFLLFKEHFVTWIWLHSTLCHSQLKWKYAQQISSLQSKSIKASTGF